VRGYMRKVKIVIEGKKYLPSLNAILSKAWQVRRHQAGLADAAVMAAVKAQNIKVVQFDKCKIVYDIYLNNKKRDIDNVATKFILDAIVKRGFIKDDNMTHVISETKNAYYDKDRPRVEVTIKEVK